MNKRLHLTILFLSFKICHSQNLVPNGSFEQYFSCPTNPGQVDSLLNWFNPCLPPYGPSGTESGSPDYFHVCNATNVGVPNNFIGYQSPYSGDGYIGMALYDFSSPFREYIEVQLTQNLIANSCYYFQMYLNLGDTQGYAADSIGVYFSDTAIVGLHSHLPLPFNPQIKNTSGFITDNLNWQLVSSYYTATGGESYLIIGNFNDDLNTNLLNVSFGSSSYYYIDDASLSVCVGIDEQNSSDIKIYPNPCMDRLNCASSITELSEFILYDISSRKLLKQEFTNFISINTEHLTKGIYIYEVRNKNGVIKKGKVVKE